MTVAFILTRTPFRKIDKTPHEIWRGKVPSLSFLKFWGCQTYVKCLLSDKLALKSDKCFFIGYPKETGGNYFYNPVEDK